MQCWFWASLIQVWVHWYGFLRRCIMLNALTILLALVFSSHLKGKTLIVLNYNLVTGECSLAKLTHTLMNQNHIQLEIWNREADVDLNPIWPAPDPLLNSINPQTWPNLKLVQISSLSTNLLDLQSYWLSWLTSWTGTDPSWDVKYGGQFWPNYNPRFNSSKIDLSLTWMSLCPV